ncbi:class C sortase [Enterococcus sp. ZJ1668]|uniref:class C sortase n=1 Tax=Enterococcus sp. ZJ1668 TaxID=2709402 RepID=UPI0013EB2CBF|nr:class C sortase [Enterococcus sp. ZJ1668]
MKNENNQIKRTKTTLLLKIFMAAMFLLGAAIFTYPFLADAINNYVDQRKIEQYQKKIAADKKKTQERQLKEYEQKNRELARSSAIPGMGKVEDPFENAVRNVKNPDKTYYEKHMIGAIYIPKINVSLPLFDETNDLLLDKGATLLQGTSFPTGGEGTHSVLTAHSGLTEKKLFTDLEKLIPEDLFFLEVAGRKLAYEVIDKTIVLPHDIDRLKIDQEKDLVTLVTCTPYAVNTHRLLVTGKRVPFPEQADKQIKQTARHHLFRLLLLLLSSLLVLSLVGYWIYRKVKSLQKVKSSLKKNK